MKNFHPLLLFLLFSTLAAAQGTGLPPGNPAYHIMDRLEIKTGIPAPFHSSLKYYLRRDVAQYALTLDSTHIPLSHLDRFDLYYIFKDNNEWLATTKSPTTLGGKREQVFKKAYTDSTNTFYTLEGTQMEASFKDDRFIETQKPLLKNFFKTPANFYAVNKPDFHFRINPILNFKLAKQNGDSGSFFYNQRGLEIRGGIDDRIYFYSNILETQAQFPDYVNEFINDYGAIPGNGFFKNYESSLFHVRNGFDFLNAQAYIAFNVTKNVGLQFGHGRNFIGNGYRSLLLSDFSNNYFYLKLNWRVWRFHYQNIFAELAADSRGGGKSGVGPKKYMAAHHLSYNITDNLNIGFYEVTIFNLNKGRDQFELQYLNPVILYRTVEQLLGSPDNVLIGFDFKWNFLHRYQLYAQLMLDEFVFDELILNSDGWWGNKFGLQAGLKYIDAFGLDHLDLQFEFNTARPYTYTHRDTLGASYTNFKQPLAHPLGANFREFLFILRYQPFKKWTVDARFLHAKFGEDSDGLNWGGNISISHNTRVMDFGNEIAQGVGTTTAILGIDVSYQFWHNMFLDLNFFYRNKNSELDERDKTTKFFGGGIRMNIGKMRMDF